MGQVEARVRRAKEQFAEPPEAGQDDQAILAETAEEGGGIGWRHQRLQQESVCRAAPHPERLGGGRSEDRGAAAFISRGKESQAGEGWAAPVSPPGPQR